MVVAPGVPAALVSVGAVDQLCDLVASPVDQVRGSAALALGFLSFNHAARRQLLSRSDAARQTRQNLIFAFAHTNLEAVSKVNLAP